MMSSIPRWGFRSGTKPILISWEDFERETKVKLSPQQRASIEAAFLRWSVHLRAKLGALKPREMRRELRRLHSTWAAAHAALKHVLQPRHVPEPHEDRRDWEAVQDWLRLVDPPGPKPLDGNLEELLFVAQRMECWLRTALHAVPKGKKTRPDTGTKTFIRDLKACLGATANIGGPLSRSFKFLHRCLPAEERKHVQAEPAYKDRNRRNRKRLARQKVG